jgi:glutamate synthase domain-containing protein 3
MGKWRPTLSLLKLTQKVSPKFPNFSLRIGGLWILLDSMDEMIGRPEFLKQRVVPGHPKANLLKLDRILRDVGKDQFAISDKMKVRPLRYKVKNTFRNIGTKLSGQIAFNHGNHGLAPGTVDVTLEGSAGQSFATFTCGGVKLTLIGEANDYIGKGLCGAEIILKPGLRISSDYKTWENSIMGNTVMYGATSGSLYAAGRAGERFCVRNSGATAVVEGIGDHGCEYMTGGTVAVLGIFGKNFGAGMSGGVAYLLDEAGTFPQLHNAEMIKGEKLTDPEDINQLKKLIFDHLEKTDSARAKMILENWSTYEPQFVKVLSKAEPVQVPAEEAEPVAAIAETVAG